jgi:DNA repair photolyase
MVLRPWGNYFAVPPNMDELIRETDWSKWRGEETMMSSMHDPYLPQLVKVTRKILEAALPAGVNICLQTRSPLAVRDFPLLAKYRDQVRLQVSIATSEPKLARIIEPRVAPPSGRFELLRKAKEAGLRVGVILAPILPEVPQRRWPIEDLEKMMAKLADIHVDLVFGESIHKRGSNMSELEEILASKLNLDGFDKAMETAFNRQCRLRGFQGTWWPEFH